MKYIFSSLFLLPFVLFAQTDISVSNPKLDAFLKDELKFDVPTISVEQLSEMKLDDIYLLDARPTAEYNVSHIKGARVIGYPALRLKANTKDIPKDATIVVYCSVGVRSENIGRRLQKLGFDDVRNLYGSIFEWVDCGLPVVNADQEETQDIHTYNKHWSQFVKLGNKVW